MRHCSASRSAALSAVLCLGGLHASVARGQITLTATDVLAFYDGVTTQTSFTAADTPANDAALQAVTALTGGGRTWTFTGLTYTPDGTITFTRVSAPQPGSDNPAFASANLIVRTDSVGTTGSPFYGYNRLTDAEFVVLGGALSLDGTLTVSRFTPGYRQPLPYTFGSTWTSESAITTEPPPPFPLEQTIREESEVVGWGTLVTPAGSEPALMIRSLDVSRSTITLPPPIPPIVTVDSTVVFSFDTRGVTLAQITLDTAGQVLNGSYSAGTRGTAGEPAPGDAALGLSVSPNPVGPGPAAVRFVLPESGVAAVRVYDALGRLVATLAEGARAAGETSVTWDAAWLPAGLYVVRVDTGGQSAVRRVSVVR